MALFSPAGTWSKASEICKIPRTELREGITFYVVEVYVHPHTWVVKHRYSDFSDLHDKLVDLHQLDRSLLPPKKIFGSHSEPFILKRQTDLELYLQTLLHRFSSLPSCLKQFLDFPKYEIRTIIENLCEIFYSQGDMILASEKPYCFSPLEIHAIEERLKLAEPTCLTGEKKHDLGHLLSFVTQLKHLEIVGKSSNHGVSNIVPNNLSFTLTAFKSLLSLKLDKVNMRKLETVEPVNKTLTHLSVHNTLEELSLVLLCGNIHWHPQDPVSQWPSWKCLTSVDFSHNSLTSIHPCIKLLSGVEKINLSYNDIQEIENLESLPRLSALDLSYNKIKQLPPLHTRLGNVCSLNFAGNKIECLQGLSRLFSLTDLQLESNCIVSLSEVAFIGKLPCLEKLNLCGNPISNSVDYRSNVLLTFGSRAGEVMLDGIITSEKEVDTVAVLQALQTAKKEQLSSDVSQNICPPDKSLNVSNDCGTTQMQYQSSVER